MTPDEVSPTPAPSAGKDPRSASGRNPDFKRVVEWLVLTLGLVTGGAASVGLVEWHDVAQYGLVGAAALMLIWFLTEELDQFLRPSKTLAFSFLFFATIVLGVVIPPEAIWLALAFAAVFWSFVAIEWRCELDSPPDSDAHTDRVLRGLGKLKARLGYRYPKAVVPLRLAVIVALFGGFATALATTDRPSISKAAPKVPPVPVPVPKPKPKPKVPNPEHPAGTPGGSEGYSKWEGRCPAHTTYPEAEWATAGILALLDGGTPLGPLEQGCLEHLNIEDESVHGLVWGVGVEPKTETSLSLIFDDPQIGIPGIVIAPAVENAEEIIKKYKSLAPDGRSFPRYPAGQGDYYLLDTYESGTCVLLRRRSGEPDEEPSYTMLPPSVAVGWLAVTRSLKKWQWVELFEGSSGTQMYKLTASGETLSDATITYDPKSGVARWRIGDETFPYPAKQRDIAPAEVEVYVKKYLR